MSQSNRKGRSRKAVTGRPPKPYKDFPLTPHASGAWQKKIRGKIFYFGRWGRRVNGKMERLPDEGWQHALQLYQAQKDDLNAGRTPGVKKVGAGLTLADLSNQFLTAKLRALKAGEITAPTFRNHKLTTDLLIAQFGKDRLVDDLAADDFGALRAVMAERWGPVRLGNEITRVRSVFKFGYDAGIITNAVRYGPEFKKPSASVLRRDRAKNGEQILEADELRRLLDAAPWGTPVCPANEVPAVTTARMPQVAECPGSAVSCAPSSPHASAWRSDACDTRSVVSRHVCQQTAHTPWEPR